ncbi:S41 family peptidase [Flavobacterium orientale]|uniref:Peptidase S41 n=1 Tax=Flavobacterium orientale TaxID=1756020 RepID=A0A917DCS6_9FLAO|nr:S41 family peptidase [Flavobacterium orientale]GGD26600.1 peptidase S41 [Flavobacterium orientale]
MHKIHFYKKANRLLALLVVVVGFGCGSVEKYNKHIQTAIPPEELIEDVNYVQKKLVKLHPSLYWYISEQELNGKFDSLRSEVKEPLTPNEFFFKISPVVAAVRQGHMGLRPLTKKLEKKERKIITKAGTGPLSQFKMIWEKDKMYVVVNKSQDTTIVKGSEVIAINGVTPQQIFSKYKNSYASDGYNTTFIPKQFQKRFSSFLANEIGVQDSLNYVFKNDEVTYTKVIKRFKVGPKKGDSLSQTQKDSIKLARKSPVAKEKMKKEREHKRIYGYDYTAKEFNKTLQFIGADSTVAYLKIKNFSSGKIKKVYEEVFAKIKEKQSKTLIIDLRDNPGGRLNEIQKLYSYLVAEEFQFIQEPEVTSRTSLFANYFNQLPILTYPIAAPLYPVFATVMVSKTKKKKDGKLYFKIKSSKPMEANPLHFDGEVYVLINGGSFSASCIIASNLQATGRAVFVGEETGGAFNGTVAGRMPVLKLPHSKLPLRLGLMDIRPVYKTEQEGRGIMPNVEIIPTVEQRIKGDDPELEYILETVAAPTQTK